MALKQGERPKSATLPANGEVAIETAGAPGSASEAAPALPNGEAAAAILAASIGCLALGVAIVATEFFPGLKTAANLYDPVGPLSGKTTFMVVVWLIAWGVLHFLWRAKQVAFGRIFAISMAIVAIAAVLDFPPFFELFTRH